MSKIAAFIRGMIEFRRCFTPHFDDDDLLTAYDHGRETAHRLTLRRYEW